MDFLEALSWLVQDELDRRRSRLLGRRHALSGLPDEKDLTSFDWSYNQRLPKRDVFELATLKFIDAKEDVLIIGPPGTGKSHVARALATAAVRRSYKVHYREAHQLIEDITEARELGHLQKLRAQIRSAELLLIDDLFLRKLPAHAGDELADVLMARHEKASTIITSNRPLDDWTRLLGDVVVVTPLLDSSHASRPPAQIRRQELAPEGGRREGCTASNLTLTSISPAARQVEEFDLATGGGV